MKPVYSIIILFSLFLVPSSESMDLKTMSIVRSLLGVAKIFATFLTTDNN